MTHSTAAGAAIRGLVFTVLIVATLATPVVADMSLVWSDEFDGTSLNTSNWTIILGDGCPDLCGWGNNELEYYRAENVDVSGGYLTLTARDEYYGGRHFTSGKIQSSGKQSFLYGRIEMRAKLPTGGGMWPAFWMMPEDDVYGGWAASGEIDIMESVNDADEISGTLHFGGSWPDNTHTGGSYSPGNVDFSEDFHIYAIEWEETEIRWYVDDVHYSTKYSSQWYSDGAPGNPLAPFDQEFFIILNSAVGGNYPGCIEPGCITANLPQEYVIDYVRVYQETGNLAPLVEITYPTEGDNPPAGDITFEATASDVDGTVTSVEFYDGTTYLGEDTTSPYMFTWTSVPDGCYSITAKAIDDGGAFGEDVVDITVGSGCGQAPFYGTPFALPGLLEAEDFDIGGEGVAYHDLDSGNDGNQYRTSEDVDIESCSDAGGGYNLGWVREGEWVEYTVDVPVSGEYTIDIRVASLSAGGSFRLEFNGLDATGDVAVPVTGGWQTWTTVSATATLSSGTQLMRFVPTVEGFNINSFDFQTETGVDDVVLGGPVLYPCYPNPFNPVTTISYLLHEPAEVTLGVYDAAGKLVRQFEDGGVIAAGRHEVIWNGRNQAGQVVAAGVYFTRLEADGHTQIRRMALVK